MCDGCWDFVFDADSDDDLPEPSMWKLVDDVDDNCDSTKLCDHRVANKGEIENWQVVDDDDDSDDVTERPERQNLRTHILISNASVVAIH